MTGENNFAGCALLPFLPHAAVFGRDGRFQINPGLPAGPKCPNAAFHLLEFGGFGGVHSSFVEMRNFSDNQNGACDACAFFVTTAARDEFEIAPVAQLDQFRGSTVASCALAWQVSSVLAGLNCRLDVQLPLVVRHVHTGQAEQHGLIPLEEMIENRDHDECERFAGLLRACAGVPEPLA